MNENQVNTDPAEARQKRIGIWASSIFALLGLVFSLFWFYNVLVLQKGHVDPGDKILLPVTILMLVAGLAGYITIQRNHLVTGLWVIFVGAALIPPVVATLILSNIYVITISYLAVFALISITWVFPRSSRRMAIVATSISLLAIAGIELWHPAFRINATALQNFAPYVIVLGGLSLLAFSIQQAITGNIRTKLIVSFISVAVISVSSVIFFADRASRTTLTDIIGNNLSGFSANQASQIGQLLENELNQLNTLAITDTIQQRAEAATAANTFSESELNALDQEWRTADATNNNSDPLVAGVLNNSLTSELLKYQAKFPENVEVFLTDLPGVSIATTDRTSDYLQSDEAWWQDAYKNGQYIGQPEFDASSKTLAINMAVAVRDRNSNRIVGILRTTVNINSLGNVLSTGLFGKTGETFIYLPDGQEIKLVLNDAGKHDLAVEKANNDINTLTKSADKFQVTSIDNAPSLASLASVSVPDGNGNAGLVKSLGWYVVTHQDQSEALAPVTKQTRNNLILVVVIVVLADLAALGLAQFLSGPIVRLTAVAERISAGDNTAQAKVETRDEIGILAITFNRMTSQLQETLQGLEQRVAARTKDLAIVAEVGTATATILESKRLLQEVVDLTKERFNLYHSHIYLLDEEGKNLVLTAGAGEPGRIMVSEGRSIPLDREQSLVARAARERKGVTVNDVTQAPDFLPNPLLPDTRSELAVPMIVGGNVIGVFDIQSEQAGRFTDSDVNIQTTLAAQLATSIQNVRSFEQSKKQAEMESVINLIGQRIQRTTSIEETLQTAIRELGMTIGASRVKTQISRPNGEN